MGVMDDSGDDDTGEARYDRGEEMNQEEEDQYVADEVNEEVDSRGKAMRSEKNDW